MAKFSLVLLSLLAASVLAEQQQQQQQQQQKDPSPSPETNPNPKIPKASGAQKTKQQMPTVDKEEDFCTLLPDGDYELPEAPCSFMYITCAVGQRIERQCAAESLRFDPISSLCLAPEYVTLCGGEATTTIAPEVVKGNADPLPDTGVDCSGREDGDYENEVESCSRVYASCVAEMITTRVCAGDLRFDSISGMCLEKEYVVACGGIATTTVEPIVPQQKIVPGFICEGDGNYQHPSGCSGRFVSCVGGAAEERECFGDLKFDEPTNMCLPAEWVPVCGGIATTTPEPEIFEREPVDYDCSGLEDGNYAMGVEGQQQTQKGGKTAFGGCSDVFVSCVSGVAHKRTCEMGLKYDVLTDSCLEEAYVEACGGTATTTVEPIVKERVQIVLGVDCGAKPDGVYPDGRGECSRLFAQCVGGFGFTGQCASEDNRYDILTNSCLKPEYVEACGGVATTPIPDGQFDPLPVPDFECSGLEDGDYAMTGSAQQQAMKGGESKTSSSGCTREYVSCVAGTPIQRHCPVMLRFDAISSRCLEIEYVEACGGESTPAPTPQEIVPPLPKLGNICDVDVDELKGDARPGMECSRYFTACVGGRDITLQCPANTRFDIDTAECMHAAYITACGGTPTEKPQEDTKQQAKQEVKLPQSQLQQ